MSQLSLNQTIKENPVCIEYHVAWSLSHQCCSLFSSLESSVEFNITRQNVSLPGNVPHKVKDSHLDVLLIYVDIAHGCGCLNELSNDNLKSAVRLHLI